MPRKRQTESEQTPLIDDEAADASPTPEEQAIRDEYRQRLVAALKSPEFRSIKGFPIGEDDAILGLSDPPYYTACPNPFLKGIVEKWQAERAATRQHLGLPEDAPVQGEARIAGETPTRLYHREPFAADVSEGKSDPIYNAHSYHTKVPHKAIMRYLLHYTRPGDIVLDGFCGTGMTGLAAQLLGDKAAVESLGYQVREGTVHNNEGVPISRLGTRKAILVDLSPAATFIASNYNTPVDRDAFEREAGRILQKIEQECGWMYETTHTDGRTRGTIRSTVWSDVFLCQNCGAEMVFWDVAVDQAEGRVRDSWKCPNCSISLSKRPGKDGSLQKAERAQESFFDKINGRAANRAKQVPVLIEYSVGSKRFEKKPDGDDIRRIQQIAESDCPDWFPITRIDRDIDLWYERDYRALGIYAVDAFYTKRNLRVLAALWRECSRVRDRYLSNLLRFTLTAMQVNLSRMNRWRANVSFPYNPLSGTLYVSGLQSEANVLIGIRNKVSRLVKIMAPLRLRRGTVAISTQSLSSSSYFLPEASVDYIFTDPPFGSNIIYSDLSLIWESWLGLFTETTAEAVIHRRKKRNPTTLGAYRDTMAGAFILMFHVLKPGHWLTVEFHNSQNAVWNAIQEAIMFAGFVVADVRTLDKQQGTFKQVTTTVAVKQDLVISAYRPSADFERRFLANAGSEQSAWGFVRLHLEQLPLPNITDGAVEVLQERLPYLLYDRMVAFHIQRGLTVPLSASEFYQGLSQRFLERDSMTFTAPQAAAYDKLRLGAQRVEQLALLVIDESTARQWLRQELDRKTGRGPQTYGELQPHFVQKLRQSRYEDMPELKVLLEQSFVKDEEGKWHVPDPENQAHFEQLRQNALLREFNEYRNTKGRLKLFRSEAIRAGFSHAWREHDYNTIVQIAQRMPEAVLQEDQQMLMYYHNASLRHSGQPKQENLL